MIVTVTFNPCLDYTIKVPDLQLGSVNRTADEAVYPGGKGVNVSLVLAALGIESKALGFAAGFTGHALEHMLRQSGCHTDFVWLKEGMTRINVKVKSAEETDINGCGPAVSSEELAELYQKLDCLAENDVLVLAGSIPASFPADAYEQILARFFGRGIRAVVDATGSLLQNVLKYRPFLIKPNHHELGELFGRELQGKKEILHYAGLLQEQGARNVLVSLAGDGAVLLAENGKIYQRAVPKGKIVNSVGAGDSMVAGFLTGYFKTGDYEKALQLGVAAGSATAFSSWLADRKKILSYLESPEAYGF